MRPSDNRLYLPAHKLDYPAKGFEFAADEVASTIPPPGFAAHRRLAREAHGDFRSGGDILIEERIADEEERNITLYGEERGGALNRLQAALRAGEDAA